MGIDLKHIAYKLISHLTTTIRHEVDFQVTDDVSPNESRDHIARRDTMYI